MEDANDYDIDKDIPTIEELEKLGKCCTAPVPPFPQKTFWKLFAHRGSAVPGSVLGPEGEGHRRRNGVTSVFAERHVYTRRPGQKAVAFLSKARKRHLHDRRVLR